MTVPANRARSLNRWGFGLVATALLLALLVFLVLVQEHSREDRDGSIHYWTTYPLGEGTAWAALVTALVLAGSGLLVLLGTAFAGPQPAWWHPAGGRPHVLSGWFITIGAITAAAYTFAALPLVAEENLPWALAAGAVCAVAALRTASFAVGVPLGLAAVPLLAIGSGAASIVLGHGALTVGILALLSTALHAERWWVRVIAALLCLAGGYVWVHAGFFLLFFVGCEYGGACFY